MIAVVLYAGSGLLHFIRPGVYLKIMPPYLPAPRALVYISGFFEILGGVGLVFYRSRHVAVWGLIALLVAVFPANLYMATNPVEAGAVSIPAIVRWGRLPLQPLLGWWVFWCSRSKPIPS